SGGRRASVQAAFRVPFRVLAKAAALLCAVAAHAASLHAQKVQPETRLELLSARTTAVHAAVGANVVAGTYARIGLLAGGGARRIRETWKSSGRVDLVARMHVDP